MNNNLFRKATVLVIGSLVVFSGQALAFSDNNQELTNADALANSELFIAQEQGLAVAIAVGAAVQAMCKVVTRVETVAVKETIPPEAIPFVKEALDRAIGSTARAESIARQNENSSAVQALAVVTSSLDNAAQAIATGDAGTTKVEVEAAVDKADEAIVMAGGEASGGCSP